MDTPFQLPRYNYFNIFKRTIGNLIRGIDRNTIKENLKNYVQIKRGKKQDPLLLRYEKMMDLFSDNSTNKTIYMQMGQSHHLYDFPQYINSPLISTMVNDYMLKNNIALGIHPSFYSSDNPEVLESEIKVYKKAIQYWFANPITFQNRQHFLKFPCLEIVPTLEKNQIQFDSSIAFPDHIGWKNSCCLPFPLYNPQSKKISTVIERPLAVMDVTLFHPDYMALSNEEALEIVSKLESICRSHCGHFDLLWHNVNFEHQGEALLRSIASWREKRWLRNYSKLTESSFRSC